MIINKAKFGPGERTCYCRGGLTDSYYCDRHGPHNYLSPIEGWSPISVLSKEDAMTRIPIPTIKCLKCIDRGFYIKGTILVHCARCCNHNDQQQVGKKWYCKKCGSPIKK